MSDEFKVTAPVFPATLLTGIEAGVCGSHTDVPEFQVKTCVSVGAVAEIARPLILSTLAATAVPETSPAIASEAKVPSPKRTVVDVPGVSNKETVPKPKLVRAAAAVVAPVPPLANATVPLTFVALPDKVPVIVPAEKLPEESRFTIILAVLESVASEMSADSKVTTPVLPATLLIGLEAGVCGSHTDDPEFQVNTCVPDGADAEITRPLILSTLIVEVVPEASPDTLDAGAAPKVPSPKSTLDAFPEILTMATEPKPKFVLAAAAVVAPVPPLATANVELRSSAVLACFAFSAKVEGTISIPAKEASSVLPNPSFAISTTTSIVNTSELAVAENTESLITFTNELQLDAPDKISEKIPSATGTCAAAV